MSLGVFATHKSGTRARELVCANESAKVVYLLFCRLSEAADGSALFSCLHIIVASLTRDFPRASRHASLWYSALCSALCRRQVMFELVYLCVFDHALLSSFVSQRSRSLTASAAIEVIAIGDSYLAQIPVSLLLIKGCNSHHPALMGFLQCILISLHALIFSVCLIALLSSFVRTRNFTASTATEIILVGDSYLAQTPFSLLLVKGCNSSVDQCISCMLCSFIYTWTLLHRYFVDTKI